MGVLLLFLALAYITGILAILLFLNWLTATYLDPQIDIYLWWSVLVYSIVPIASFFLKRYFRKHMRKESWNLKGIAWVVFGLCFINWMIGLAVIKLVGFANPFTIIDTRSVIVIGAHLFSMILFYRLSQRIK